jgi:hypothetical protein
VKILNESAADYRGNGYGCGHGFIDHREGDGTGHGEAGGWNFWVGSNVISNGDGTGVDRDSLENRGDGYGCGHSYEGDCEVQKEMKKYHDTEF